MIKRAYRWTCKQNNTTSFCCKKHKLIQIAKGHDGNLYIREKSNESSIAIHIDCLSKINNRRRKVQSELYKG